MSVFLTDLPLELHISVHLILEVYKSYSNFAFFMLQLLLTATLVVDNTNMDTDNKQSVFCCMSLTSTAVLALLASLF
jgi:hypothetical protein